MVKRATIHVSSRKNSATMNKNNQVNNQVENQNHGDHCQHVQIGGQAYYDDRKYFLFFRPMLPCRRPWRVFARRA